MRVGHIDALARATGVDPSWLAFGVAGRSVSEAEPGPVPETSSGLPPISPDTKTFAIRAGIAGPQLAEAAERLRWAVHQRGGGPRAVSANSGIPLSSLGQWLAGREMRTSAVARIAQVCGVDPAWLAWGAATAPISNDPAADIDRYRAVSRFRKDDVYETAGLAGPTAQVVDHLAFSEDFLRRDLNIDADRLLLVVAIGDSMQPTVEDGDLLVVDVTQRAPVGDTLYVCNFDGILFVRRLSLGTDGSVQLRTDNARYKSLAIPRSARGSLRVLGRVIWRGGTVP